MASSGSRQSIFITGGTGFVGREIVLRLSAAHPDWALYVYDLAGPSAELRGVRNTTFVQGDINDAEALSRALAASRATAVVHTAGMVPPLTQRYGKAFRDTVWKINVEGTRAVLAACRRETTGSSSSSSSTAVRALVWTGSCCAVIDDFRYAYPNVDESWATTPLQAHNTIYGESKAVAEAEVLAANGNHEYPAGFRTCSLRPSTLFGDTDSQLLAGIHAMVAAGETAFVIGDGTNLWDVCHAGNVADAHVLALENLLEGDGSAAGEAFFIGNEEPIPFRAFCLAIWREFGHYPPFEITVPTGLAWFAGLVAESVSWLLGRDPGLRRASVADATAVRYADGGKARRILGYTARIPLHEGIARSCQLYKKRLEEKVTEGEAKSKKR